MQIKPLNKTPRGKLTFVIADSSPIDYGESVKHRTVHIELTPEQLSKLQLRRIGPEFSDWYEDISQVFFEENNANQAGK